MKDVNFLIANGADVQKSLELFGDIDTYNATLPDFLSGLQEKTGELQKYKASADMQNYAIIVHSVKSDARYFGFMTLGELAYQHEMKSKENDSDFVYQNFEFLMAEIARVLKVIGSHDKQILVVDDSSVVISFVQKIFSNQYDVITASDGAEALKIIEGDTEGKIACMLLDIYMPNVNGFGVLEYFKSHNLFPKIPVSVITGAYTQEVIDMVKQYAIVDLLAKPFNEANVKDVIVRTIEAKEL